MKHKKLSILVIVLMVLSLFACNETAYDESDNIIEVSQVSEVYLDGDVILVDARDEAAYNKLHLKGAISLRPDELLVDKPVPALVAPKAKFERVLSKKGLSNDSVVYIYDDKGGVYAFRLWWTMKLYGHENVKVINGGFQALNKAGLKGEVNATNLAESKYLAKDADPSLIVDFETVRAASENSDVKIIDVRSLAEYDAGSIPGAILYPHTNNLYKDGSFMSARDTYLFYKDKGFERDDEIYLYCKSSFRATQTLALLQEAGFKNVKVYDGAWIEWEALGGTSASSQDKAPVTSQDGS